MAPILGIKWRQLVSDAVNPTDGAETAKGRAANWGGEPVEPVTRERTGVFISYSHSDRTWLDRVLVHLTPLQRDFGIEVWTDRRIQAGANWRAEISDALRSAKVAVLLISGDFLASDFIANHELPSLLKASESEGLAIIPLIIKPSRFNSTNLSEFQAINDPSRPIISLNEFEQECIFVKLSEIIEQKFTRIVRFTKPVEDPVSSSIGILKEEVLDEKGRQFYRSISQQRQMQVAPMSEFIHDRYGRIMYRYLNPRGNKHYNIRVWLEGPNDELDTIDTVEYLLHPSFKKTIRISRNRGDNFSISFWAFASFSVNLTIFYPYGRQAAIRYYIPFNLPKDDGTNYVEVETRK